MKILSKPQSTLEQCIQWAKNKKASDLYLSIVPILYNTAVQEGVEPTLVVVQCAKETGYCRFGGVLNASFKNTCGLKSPKGGGCKDPDAHMKFKSWEDGVLAQVQHLALYAGQKGYPVKDPTDPRHFSYLLGKCKTIESLSGNWAGKGYGEDLIKMIKEIKSIKINKEEKKMANYYCWLDAGHSKATGGKRNTIANPDFFEYEFNNDIAVKLKKRLEAHGITVYLTNTTPNGADISLTTRANTANTKYKALGKPANSLFVSIHANAAGSCASWSRARGVETYHAKNASANSKRAAKAVNNQIFKDIYAIDKGFKNRGVKASNFTVIYKAAMPSILIEHAFYDNKADLNILQNKRDILVEADCKGICAYFGITYKKPASNNNTVSQPVQQPSTGFKQFLGRCNTDNLNCRKGPGTSYDVVQQIDKGVVITIVGEQTVGSTKWYKAKSGYYVSAKYIDFVRYV